MSVAAGLPGSFVSLYILWTGDYSAKVQWTLTVFIVCLWWGFALAVRERTVMPLQTIANLLEALREGDYSIRARVQRGGNSEGTKEQRHHLDALGEVMAEVNLLGDLLRRQRFHAVDAAALLESVIAEIDLAVFTFDEKNTLRLVNRAGQRMMAQPTERLLGRTAEDLGLADCLEGEEERTFERSFPGQTGRWQVRRSTFREGGLPHHLLVLSDLSRALRDEERQAWQRLIRVLGHELNNSLAPMKSTAATLETLLGRESPHEGWRDDARRGLRMIAERSESLARFVAAYSRLARLPAPKLRPTSIGAIVRRVVQFETRWPVTVEESPEVVVSADPDQLERLLINLVKNAVEAALETGTADQGGEVAVEWQVVNEQLEVEVRDRGPGLANTQNLFVPFFTTKEGGTGIGLVLCRQIAEAHEGSLTLENRAERVGCVARLRLPLRG